MELNTKKNILKIVKQKGIKFIKIWFVDILGQLKSFTITERELERALEEGMGVDGSSIEGFARIHESDLLAIPDPSTFVILPWRVEVPTARMFCDILNPDRTSYEGDTRYILKKNLALAKELGYTFYVGPELEYFYLKNEHSTEILDEGGYFDYVPRDEALDLRRDTMLYLEKMGIHVEYSHHEVSASQHEIDLLYTDALKMADNVLTYKVTVKHVAWSKNLYATFMPKPIFGINGSGMHVHQSLFKNDKNAFFSNKKPYYLSDTAKHYLAGLLKHIPEITVVLNQWVNSYKRLVPGYEAPAYICWGHINRSALVRMPMSKPGKEKSVRIELRSPDPACNPYLAFSLMLAAGLKGIKEKYELTEPVEDDIYTMADKEREKNGIKSLPGSLMEALSLFEKSKLARECLGEHIFEKFIENKKIEWNEYRTQVTDYEIKKYLPIL